jgi:hypothetical protein
VVGGVEAAGHGHVVVVVDGPVSQKGPYPYSFWGKYQTLTVLGKTMNVGFTNGHGTLNWAFGPGARDAVVYAAFSTSPLTLPEAHGNEGYLLYTFT